VWTALGSPAPFFLGHPKRGKRGDGSCSDKALGRGKKTNEGTRKSENGRLSLPHDPSKGGISWEGEGEDQSSNPAVSGAAGFSYPVSEQRVRPAPTNQWFRLRRTR